MQTCRACSATVRSNSMNGSYASKTQSCLLTTTAVKLAKLAASGRATTVSLVSVSFP